MGRGEGGPAAEGAADPGRCRDALIELARAACIVVAAETAYDITDSLKTGPDQYPVYFYELARLAAKLLKDIERGMESVEDEKRGLLGVARGMLLGFRERLEKAVECLEDLDEEARRRLVLEFAALAVAPDKLAHQVASLLYGK